MGHLMEQHATDLVRFLRRQLRDPGQAEDVAQVALVRAFRKLDLLEDPAAFRGWLWSIARCAALDHVRSTENDARVESFTAGLHSGLQQEVASDLLVEHDQLLESVRDVLDTLPSDPRRLLELRFRDSLSYREIGERTGLGEVRVKARIARLRARLRPKLEGIAREWKRLRDELP
ncbi:MAG: sigma-70 family RNA polymerase sigma factor [Planctomycetes bacterium]|nr:sigma-70 family RNA polymerase sigma factor [Planctomycetota bacterium]